MNNLCIVLSGGAIKGFGILGALQYIDELYDITTINCFIGTSIGSIIGYMSCLGMKPLEIVHSVIKAKILEKMRSEIDINEVMKNWGFANFECILEELEILTLAKFGKVFTLGELYKELGKELGCVTFNYTKYKTEYIHYSTHPQLPCLTAIQMSSAIPVVFNKCEYENCLYVDGGVVDNFPIRMAVKLQKDNIIGISSNEFGLMSSSSDYSLSKLLSIPSVEKTYRTIKKFRKKFPIVTIEIDYDVLDFSLQVPEIMEMFSTGYKNSKIILKPK